MAGSGGGAATDECSRAVCTVYCPQFCDITVLFPPPSPLGLGESSFSLSLSPLLIALIAILAAAVLLAAYNLAAARLRRRRRRRLAGPAVPSSSFRRDAAAAAGGGGLDESTMRRIAVCRYKKEEGLVMAEECPVCLAEFREGESLRLLPDCLHAFHLACIDPWLKANTSCPICRATIDLSSPPPPPPQLPPRLPLPLAPPTETKAPATSGTHSSEV
ncbi:RING-H2 finger protein ATL51-like [Wolffia australiana]